MVIILNDIKYKIELTYRQCKINYGVRMSLFLSVISIIAKGTNENIEVFVKILFFKKKLKTDFKQHRQNKIRIEGDMEDTSFHIINTIEVISRHKEHLGKFISIIKPKYVKIEGIYGFEDPYITGILSGFIGAISLLLPAHSIKLNPDFFNKVFNLEVKVEGKTRIILLIVITLKFLICNAYENVMTKLKAKFKKRSKMGKIKFKSSDEMKFD